MQSITLYKYTRPDGGTTVSTVKPDCEYVELVRLVADEGKALTDGMNVTTCTDTDNPGAWSEVEDTENPDAMTETEQKARAYDILTGVSE